MLSDELIVKIGADLDVLPLQPTSRRELEMLLSRIAGSNRAAQERGATYTEIAIQISASGYPSSAAGCALRCCATKGMLRVQSSQSGAARLSQHRYDKLVS